MVMSSQALPAVGTYFLTLSATESLPRSWRIKIAIAVNCLVIEPRRNLVFGAARNVVLEVGHAKSAAEQDLAVPGEQNRAAQLSTLDAGGHDTRSILDVSFSGDGRSRHAWAGRNGEAERGDEARGRSGQGRPHGFDSPKDGGVAGEG